MALIEVTTCGANEHVVRLEPCFANSNDGALVRGRSKVDDTPQSGGAINRAHCLTAVGAIEINRKIFLTDCYSCVAYAIDAVS